jgi:hypothetical protein
MQLSQAAQDIVDFWTTTRAIPFKGKLIYKNDDGTCSMCAQGQVLYRNGYSEEALLNMSIFNADKETARILGISAAHSVFLRHINDRVKGSPQEVLTNPEKYLGPNWEKVLNFWEHLDSLTEDQLKVVRESYRNLSVEEQMRSIANAYNAAKATTEYVSYAGSVATLYMPSLGDIPAYVTCELIGNVENPVFVPLFYNHENL